MPGIAPEPNPAIAATETNPDPETPVRIPRWGSSPESIRKPTVPILDDSAVLVVVLPAKQAVKVAVFDVGNGSQSPPDFWCRMRAFGDNALALK